MIELPTTETDDPGYVDEVRTLMVGTMRLINYPAGSTYKLDNWFDHKWLGFGGVWREWDFDHYEVHYEEENDYPPFRRGKVGPDIRIGELPSGWWESNDRLWFCWSDGTALNGRGALMIYAKRDDEDWRWYASLVRSDDGAWSVERTKQISMAEIAQVRSLGAEWLHRENAR